MEIEANNEVPFWATNLIFIAEGSLMINTETGEVLECKDFDNLHLDKILYDGPQLDVKPSQWLLSNNMIEKYYRMVNYTGMPAGVILNSGLKYFNIHGTSIGYEHFYYYDRGLKFWIDNQK